MQKVSDLVLTNTGQDVPKHYRKEIENWLTGTTLFVHKVSNRWFTQVNAIYLEEIRTLQRHLKIELLEPREDNVDDAALPAPQDSTP